MDTVVIASTEQDAAAVEAVKGHHAEMAGTLALLARRVVGAAADGNAGSAFAARDELVRWAEGDLVPHALAEEKALYPLAHQDSRARLLIDAMLVEHQLILGLVASLKAAPTPVEAAAESRALSVTFESHLAKENEQVLPLLAASPDVSVAAALAGMHELLGGGHAHEATHEEAPAARAGCGGACACGETDRADLPELDARAVPHAIRHATIFGALDAVRSGSGMVLVAPHDPLPLLKQLEERAPGAFTVDYLERGPEAWRLRFVRVA